MWLLKCAWRCSLPRLMESCSMELTSKHSKPAMSRTPKYWPDKSPPSDNTLLILAIKNLNNRPYINRARPSLAYSACARLRGATVTSLPTLSNLHTKDLFKSSNGMPSMSAVSLTGLSSFKVEPSPASANSVFPKVKTPITTLKISSCMADEKPSAESAAFNSSKNCRSSTFGATCAESLMYLYFDGSMMTISSPNSSFAWSNWKNTW
mmetsp:Transcript_37081/g.112070  ORF Transcript_37081/g.112070 Transcript_37081/m.112070 type:complete len:208 (-) Transcript_37081:391-1014(-)